MRQILIGLGSGVLFGVGLVVAGMTRPSKVVAFLDVFGDWDPSLAFVMGGAIVVHFLAYRLVPRMPRPLFAGAWTLPSRRDVDARLLVGAAMFGAGWGISGYCPGPALTSVVSGASPVVIFTLSMLAGMWGYSRWERARSAR